MHKLQFRLLCVVILIGCTSFHKEGLPALPEKGGHEWEEFDPDLFYRLQSVSDIIAHTDSAIGVENRHASVYTEFLASVVRKRFYHGYSYYTPKDNWLAWLAGTLVWDHLHAIVIPDDIMKHPMAACSQQAIIMKECFKQIGIDYREVDLNGHFVLEGRVNGKWLLFDTNLEPKFISGRKSLRRLIKNDELEDVYMQRLSREQVQEVFEEPIYKEVNAPIAANGMLFQQVTGFLSLTLPIMLPLGLLVFLVKRRNRKEVREPDGVKFVEVEENVEMVEVLRSR